MARYKQKVDITVTINIEGVTEEAELTIQVIRDGETPADLETISRIIAEGIASKLGVL